MRTLDLGRAQPKQTLFLKDKHRHIAYGGARGGGKSWAVRTKSKLLAFRYPGIKILIVRKTYKELQNNHIEQLTAELAGFAKYNRSDKMFRFPNGSTISFGYCANEGDLGQYQGAEYDVVFIDEAGQLQESWIRKINLCVRGTNGFPKRTYYTLNPGGPGHAYFKRVFVDRNFNPDEDPDDYFFIQAKVEDNKALMDTQPDYLRELENLPPTLRWWCTQDGNGYVQTGIAQAAIRATESRKVRKWRAVSHTAPTAGRRWTVQPNERAAVCSWKRERRRADAGLLLDLQESGIQKELRLSVSVLETQGRTVLGEGVGTEVLFRRGMRRL